jgi:hypothetical protein
MCIHDDPHCSVESVSTIDNAITSMLQYMFTGVNTVSSMTTFSIVTVLPQVGRVLKGAARCLLSM